MDTRMTGQAPLSAAQEIEAVGALAGTALVDLTHAIRQGHEGLSRAIDAVTPRPLRRRRPTSAFGPIAHKAYRRAETAAGKLPVDAAVAINRAGLAERLAPSNSPAGRTFLSFVNGLWPATRRGAARASGHHGGAGRPSGCPAGTRRGGRRLPPRHRPSGRVPARNGHGRGLLAAATGGDR